jgi:hypothetical protein
LIVQGSVTQSTHALRWDKAVLVFLDGDLAAEDNVGGVCGWLSSAGAELGWSGSCSGRLLLHPPTVRERIRTCSGLIVLP